MRTLVLTLLLALPALPADMLQVKRAKKDVALSADPASAFWKNIPPVLATKDNFGVETPGHRTEIRARWTGGNLYILMNCPYEDLNLIETPSTTTETNKLWDHDVAEIFIGGDLDNIYRYREYQVSPQGEWVDLDIDRKNPLPAGGWKWDSGMRVKARLDKASKVWYGEFQIPLKSITDKKVEAGTRMRGNFYRFQGAPPKKRAVAWMPTGKANNHMPEMFGTIEFVK